MRERRGEGAHRAAVAAREAAGEEFYRLDSAQRAARIAVSACLRLEPGPEAQSLLAELAPLDAAADALSARYIATIDGFDLGDPALPHRTLTAAAEAFAGIAEELRGGAARLEGYLAAHASAFARVDRAMVAAGAAVTAAAAALGRAREAAGALGPDLGDVATALAAAEAAAERLEGGVVTHGVPETLERAATAVRAAEDARLAAATARERSTALRRRLGSLRLRSEGAAHRASLLEPDLSALRRSFVAASWRDVDAALAAARPLLGSVPQLLRNTDGLLEAGEREQAAAVVRVVVRDLEQLESAVDEVARRRHTLEALAADPEQAVARAHFAVRDAQRLALAGPGKPRLEWVTRLDTLVARLERLATSVSPGDRRRDWWAFQGELDVVVRAAATLVQEIRAARSASPRR